MSEDTQKGVVAQSGDTASVEQSVSKLTAAQKKAAAKAKVEAEAEIQVDADEGLQAPIEANAVEAESESTEKAEPVTETVAAEAEPIAETAIAAKPFEPESYPATVLLVNRTYATVAYPEVGNVCLRGGESQVVTVKTAEIMATLQRNVNSFNGIGKWVAPHGVFIEAVPEAEQE